MSKKESKYSPSYQIAQESGKYEARKVQFGYQGAYFVTRDPFIGATATQKEVLRWASYKSTPPVLWVKHDQPTPPDKGGFRDNSDLHWHYVPYAMTVATFLCLGEEKPRTVKVYFCNATMIERASGSEVRRAQAKIAYLIPVES